MEDEKSLGMDGSGGYTAVLNVIDHPIYSHSTPDRKHELESTLQGRILYSVQIQRELYSPNEHLI